MTQCQNLYKKTFRLNKEAGFYKEPTLENGKIQLGFANSNEADKFFYQLQQQQNPKQPFIATHVTDVTDRNKVLGYTSPGGDYRNNYPDPKNLNQIQEQMKAYRPFEAGQKTADEMRREDWKKSMMDKLESEPPGRFAAPLTAPNDAPYAFKQKEEEELKAGQEEEQQITVEAITTEEHENPFLKSCRELYKKQYKNEEHKPWYQEPQQLKEGGIQLSFKDDNQIEDFLNSMAK